MAKSEYIFVDGFCKELYERVKNDIGKSADEMIEREAEMFAYKLTGIGSEESDAEDDKMVKLVNAYGESKGVY